MIPLASVKSQSVMFRCIDALLHKMTIGYRRLSSGADLCQDLHPQPGHGGFPASLSLSASLENDEASEDVCTPDKWTVRNDGNSFVTVLMEEWVKTFGRGFGGG